MYNRNFHIVVIILLVAVAVDARKLLVGPSRTCKTPCEAAGLVQSGDTVEIDSGLYLDQACVWSVSNTVIRAVTKFARLKAPAVIPNQKAILVISGDNTIVENLEFSDASVPDRNGAGIRQEGKNVSVRNCLFHHCEDGILGGSGYVVIENSEFAFCGYGDGYSHNMYIGACDSFMLRFCYTHDASEGHTIKSRALRNYILYNRIESANSTTSYEINLPNGGASFIIGNQVQQGANSHNSSIIDFGSEGISGHDSMLYVINNTIVNDRGAGTFISVSGTQNRPNVYNNIFAGNGTICTREMDSAGNVVAGSPGFADKTNFDYHLTSSSPAINRGVSPGAAGSFGFTSVFQYVHNSSGAARTITGSAIDAGAFEYGDVGVVMDGVRFGVQQPVVLESKIASARYDLMGRCVPWNVVLQHNSGHQCRFVNFRFMVGYE